MKAKKKLDLGSSRIDDLDTFTIALYLSEKHTNLELIHLGANLFGDEGLINSLSGLQYHENSIREIYLGNDFLVDFCKVTIILQHMDCKIFAIYCQLLKILKF